jgi:peptidoglycan hydrolase-like protein with peptidoglycan-binding domain
VVFTHGTLTFTIPCTTSSGSTAQNRVNNLLSMGNTTLANQIAKQYNIVIPNTKTTPNTPTFTRSLQLGMTGNDVKQLQIFLNSKGFTVSYTGPGSKGNETTFFGIKTKLSLIKYQKANNITPAIGNFGPLTRAQILK